MVTHCVVQVVKTMLPVVLAVLLASAECDVSGCGYQSEKNVRETKHQEEPFRHAVGYMPLCGLTYLCQEGVT